MFPDARKAQLFDEQVERYTHRLKIERRWLRGSQVWMVVLVGGTFVFLFYTVMDVYNATFGEKPLSWLSMLAHGIVAWYWGIPLRKRHQKNIDSMRDKITEITLERGFARLQADLYRPEQEVSDADREEG